METILPVEVRWYGNWMHVIPGMDLTNDVALNLALYNYAISAAHMQDVEIGDPYLQIVNGRDLFGFDRFDLTRAETEADYICWFAQGATFPEGRTAQITMLYDEHARRLFGLD